jgi:uncharacterized membrane-anchored protein YhcB (DUF1043 family)
MSIFKGQITEPDLQKQMNDNKARLKQMAPIVQSIHSNAAIHFLNKGVDLVLEFLLYIMGVVCFGFVFIMDTIFPFHILGEIVNKPAIRETITNSADLDTFQIAVKGLVILIVILFILLGFLKNSSRQQKAMLQKAGIILKENEKYFVQLNTLIETELPKVERRDDHLTKIEGKSFPETLT